MNQTISEFYSKNPEEDYAGCYDRDHGPRLDHVVEFYKLRTRLAGKCVVDVGGGLGFLGKRIPEVGEYVVIDGARIDFAQRLCRGLWVAADLDHEHFAKAPMKAGGDFDAAFCLETLEHISNPYHCLVEIKKLVKRDGDVYLSIPPPSVWHNTVYPGLLWPVHNFVTFLEQMALPILELHQYDPKDRGWPAWQFHCRNADWVEAKMVFPKHEEKFRGKTPLEYTNL